MRIYFIRHADPNPAADALTPVGHRQAAVLAEHLAQIGIDAIYGSPLTRSVETMEPTARRLNLEPVIEPWLCELDWFLAWGNAIRRSAWNLPGEIFRADDPFMLPNTMLAGYEELQRASDCFLHGLGYQRVGRRYRPIRPNEKRIALFSHGGIGLAWMAHLFDLPLPLFWSAFWLDPCSVTTIHFEQHSGAWAVPRCLGCNDIGHLRVAGLPCAASSIFHKFLP